jgi:hypothetical protein
MVVGTLSGATAAWLLFDRLAAIPWAAVAFACVTVALGIPDVYSNYDLALNTVTHMAIGVLWLLLIAVPLLMRDGVRSAPWWIGGTLIAGMSLLLPPARFATDPIATFSANLGPPLDWADTAVQSLTLANVVLSTTLVLLFARSGGDRHSLRDRGLVILAMALVISLAADPVPFSWIDTAAVGVTVLGLAWLLPKATNPAARVVSATTHTQLVRAELRRRLLRTTAADVYRGARARLAADQDALDSYDDAQARLDDAVIASSRPVDGVPVGEAFTTDAGQPPLANALAAIAYAAPASALLVGYEMLAMFQQHARPLADLTLLNLVDQSRHLLRWPAYAALYGFYYPLMRGSNPIHKALNLAIAVLGAELLPILSNPQTSSTGVAFLDLPTTPRQLAVAVLVRAGQVLVFFIALGLLWERRLALLADVSWNRLRDIRRATTLAAPIGTLILTIATALGTALAGAAAAALISNTGTTPPTTPRPTTSESAPP